MSVTPALLLVDLQNDFLAGPGLEPAAGAVVARATRLLENCRARSIPVVHVWTTVRGDEDRMPHWIASGKWICRAGSHGAAPPAALQPADSETVVHKTGYSAFASGELDEFVASRKIDTLWIAGVHLHACVRVSAVDGYQRGLRVHIVDDAVGSDDPLHAETTRRYLGDRGISFVRSGALFEPRRHARPRVRGGSLQRHPGVDSRLRGNDVVAKADVDQGDTGIDDNAASPGGDSTTDIAAAIAGGRQAWAEWRETPLASRVALLERLAGALRDNARALNELLVGTIGKPIHYGRAEVARSVDLVLAAARQGQVPAERACGPDSIARHRSVGVIAMVTPWNNPVGIPIGKLAPALVFGNAVVWKPAPEALAISERIMELIAECGCPPGVVTLIRGGRRAAAAVMADANTGAITITGSPGAGWAAIEISARRGVPLQAELGGNNAAIVWADADLRSAAEQIAEGAFGFAGQRCTANRRVIVDASCYERFLPLLCEATSALAWGDPTDEQTRVGPLVSPEKHEEVRALVERARSEADAIWSPAGAAPRHPGPYFPPTIVCCSRPAAEIVQEESFAPILVVQQASTWEQALELCNGVRQGLVAALFSSSGERQARFLRGAEAGILKINRSTAGAGAAAPFGGWKASGVGPPEHGESNREFYTRTQAIYGWESS